MARRYLCIVPAILLGLPACSNLSLQDAPTTTAHDAPEHAAPPEVQSGSRPLPTMLASSQPVTGIQVTQLDELIVGDLWQVMREQFRLDVPDNSRVRIQRNWYASHPDYMDRVTQRSKRYLWHIQKEVEKRGMPAEIALLPIVESAFDPFAYSHGRAAGLWQFIPSTGKRFGLKQNWWYDGRRDLIDSTGAALDYLEYLHRRFKGDWLLALAAYNSGEGTVSKAVRNNRKKGRKTDFWSLKLPRETRAYVPKLLALSQLVSDPERWGIQLEPVPDAPGFEVIDIGDQIDLAVAADLAGIPLEALYRFNPGYNQWATDPDGPYRLLIPADNAERFRAGLASLPPEKRIRWERHKVRSGETLSGIAKRYHTTARALQAANGLRGSTIRAGKHLLVPVSSQGLEGYSLSASQRLSRLQDRARGGTRTEHVVRSGDNLWDLSRRYKIGLRKLAASNGMAPGDPLRVGQKLVIWTGTGKSSSNPANRIRPVYYTVRKGDSLARISQRFKVSLNDLRKWNRLPKNRYLQPGQKLKLYVDVSKQADST